MEEVLSYLYAHGREPPGARSFKRRCENLRRFVNGVSYNEAESAAVQLAAMMLNGTPYIPDEFQSRAASALKKLTQ